MSARIQLPAPTVVSFRRGLRLLGNQPPGFRVTRAWLLEQRLPANAVYPVLEAMRFFGLLDDSQRVGPGLRAFMEDKQLRQRAVRTAYAPLLEQLELPVDNRKQLIAQLEGRVRAATSLVPMVATFLAWALAYAGEPILRRSPAHRPGPRPGVLRPEQALEGEPVAPLSGPSPRAPGRRKGAGPMVGFTVQVGPDTSEEEIEQILDRIETVWKRRQRR